MSNSGKYSKILVGVDDSENARRAFFEAAHIAKRNNATLYIVHVVNNIMGYLTEEALSQLQEEGHELCRNLQEQVETIGLKEMIIISEVGSPKQLIAKDLPSIYEVDLLVLGATGKHRLQESVLGSLPHYATSHTDCNVLIVRR
ncbi:universal stress protein [Vagococcus sp. BWB3-3]|uniref:Universal stress protein n=1 Tax=Vagococcus allomyrinae TaxID=2794353 RepID=A0A940SSN2_9ENTE|nr:universal stress protein [Vagococcus allomyrinae]MBP1042147.1 universal stress protein [Vagococcus allomyrinae]